LRRAATRHLQTENASAVGHHHILGPRAEDEAMTAPPFQIDFVKAALRIADCGAVRAGEVLEVKRYEAPALQFNGNGKVMPCRGLVAACLSIGVQI
jgi:hypothetical protein